MEGEDEAMGPVRGVPSHCLSSDKMVRAQLVVAK